MITIEPPAMRGSRPIVESDLPFLRFEPLEVREQPYTTPDSMQRIHTYRVKFASMPEQETFVGELRAIDPWDRGHIEKLNVFGRAKSPIRVSPSGITLVAGDSSGTGFLVRTEAPAPDLAIEVDRGESSPLTVEPKGSGSSDRFRAFNVKLKPGAKATEGEYDLIVRLSPSSPERQIVHVRVVGRSGD